MIAYLSDMYDSTVVILRRELWKAFYETALMLLISFSVSAAAGGLLGLQLFVGSSQLTAHRRVCGSIIGWIINVVRSIPFIILTVFSLPLTFLITGTKIGPVAAAVPLSMAATAFFARLMESALRGVSPGVIEAAVAQGASLRLIITDVLLVEAAPAIVRGLTITFISLIGFSAMAGMVGGGGVGNLAIQYGYYRYETGVMLFTIITLVAAVQLVQLAGDRLARHLSH